MPVLSLQSTAKAGLFSLSEIPEPAVLIKPTSISHSGTSASIGENGQVTFTAITSLPLNGVFSADFDNYMVSIRHVHTVAGGPAITLRMRLSGSDATGSNYVIQYISAASTSVTAERRTSQNSALIAQADATQRSGDQYLIYGPFLAQPTAFRSVTVSGNSSAYLFDIAGTHSLSTSYDGFTLAVSSGNLTGALQVYGIRM